MLTDNECPIYPARPFGCRCFISKHHCTEKGYAYVDPFVITVNNLFLQYIEHIDTKGFSGNMTDVMLFMESEDNRDSYRKRSLKRIEKTLIPNLPIRAVLIPPEHKTRIKPFLTRIRAAFQ